MQQDSVEDVIRKLEKLHIEERKLLNELIAARRRETTGDTNRGTAGFEAEAATNTVNEFEIGDRVQITNPVRGFFGGKTKADSVGTVTRITPQRVHIKTDSGPTVQRAPKNVKHYDN